MHALQSTEFWIHLMLYSCDSICSRRDTRPCVTPIRFDSSSFEHGNPKMTKTEPVAISIWVIFILGCLFVGWRVLVGDNPLWRWLYGCNSSYLLLKMPLRQSLSSIIDVEKNQRTQNLPASQTDRSRRVVIRITGIPGMVSIKSER